MRQAFAKLAKKHGSIFLKKFQVREFVDLRNSTIVFGAEAKDSYS
jgi:hypothetical protein